eukprot:TRINITY_DN3234_c0_g2_i13.p1 TRINITY_DN3234_c0_g2~~TRINITY_DN3234_c0_g2_i13.p1  ORF type:complete len:461 (-),score=54.73 TRINITY_DN3234_c0_g2_i13:422-1804(-)
MFFVNETTNLEKLLEKARFLDSCCQEKSHFTALFWKIIENVARSNDLEKAIAAFMTNYCLTPDTNNLFLEKHLFSGLILPNETLAERTLTLFVQELTANGLSQILSLVIGSESKLKSLIKIARLLIAFTQKGSFVTLETTIQSLRKIIEILTSNKTLVKLLTEVLEARDIELFVQIIEMYGIRIKASKSEIKIVTTQTFHSLIMRELRSQTNDVDKFMLIFSFILELIATSKNQHVKNTVFEAFSSVINSEEMNILFAILIEIYRNKRDIETPGFQMLANLFLSLENISKIREYTTFLLISSFTYPSSRIDLAREKQFFGRLINQGNREFYSVIQSYLDELQGQTINDNGNNLLLFTEALASDILKRNYRRTMSQLESLDKQAYFTFSSQLKKYLANNPVEKQKKLEFTILCSCLFEISIHGKRKEIILTLVQGYIIAHLYFFGNARIDELKYIRTFSAI